MLTYRYLCNKLFEHVDYCNWSVLAYCNLYIVGSYNIMRFHELLTIDEVAQYLRVKRRTIYEWVKKGKIPAIKTVGQWRFKKDRIDAWLDGK